LTEFGKNTIIISILLLSNFVNVVRLKR